MLVNIQFNFLDYCRKACKMNMFKTCFLLTLLLLGLFLAPITHSKENHTHERIGYHGMVLFSDSHNNIYASHLPLYASPHDYQIIYQLELKNKALLTEHLTQGLVTILPEKFDLNYLVNGERIALDTRFYSGHFERGGQEFNTQNVVFSKAILIKRVDKSFRANKHMFYVEQLADGHWLLVHKIQHPPSFDLLAIAKPMKNNQLKNLSCLKSDSFKLDMTYDWFSHCPIERIKYFERDDFAQ